MKPAGVLSLFLSGCLLSGVAGVRLAHANGAEGPPAPAPMDVDCGLASLYLLLRLEGHPVTLPSLSAQLPPLPAEGHSMRDLRDVARRGGLRVAGVLLPPDTPAPRSTGLAFVNRRGHGHFLVIRPVGHTGKLVQVFDGFGGPVVMDWSNLRGSSEWTGLMLMTEPRGWRRWSVAMIALVGALALVLFMFRRDRCRCLAGEGRPCP